ncbi:propanediol/glycerol family dehydratase large subunit [Fodinicurvata halophila]|uniref:Propanediol/glycerol family dehydratase large subunit n=1 Tax=Fodinicurvata halophila TaxID=1419723 RepID=A0ABV8UG98_9PROT
MTDTPSFQANRWRRFDDWDARALRLDKFAVEDPENGFSAFEGAADPEPSLDIVDGRIEVMDGIPATDFDMIDSFVAAYHLDPEIAAEAMAMPSQTLARMLVDMNVPREELTRLARGLTPAKLAEVVAQLNAMELAFAYSKMRARSTPGNQAHVTNAKDDPLQLAADAAVAVALGFDEIETTMRVAQNSWANALACCIGSAVGQAGTLFQCSSEEAEELQIGMAGFTSYAETVSVYGTESAFVDGDDTPWSKAWLAAAYASRGIKMRCTSGAAAELLMGFHEAKSLLYLEARCLCLQRGMGAQGTQNGGIDGAPLAGSMPGGVRELLAENLLAVWLDLECASGNDARHSESDMRVGAKILPYLIAGSDLICSGFGSILKYDNSFNPSSFNGEELEEFLVLQRDFEADGGLRTIDGSSALALRRQAIDALSFVLKDLELAEVDETMKQSVAVASGSKETQTLDSRVITEISRRVAERGITILDVMRALHRGGFRQEVENLLFLLKLRLSGDYLQTSAVVREGRVLSAVNDPNRYQGPGTGYRPSAARRKELADIRDVLNREDVLRFEATLESAEQARIEYRHMGQASPGTDRSEVVVGISPGLGTKFFQTLAGHPLSTLLQTLKRGIEDAGGVMRVVRFAHTADTSFLGLSAARLSGSGIGIGLQSKGTAVIHHRDRLPHNNLEIFSNAPITMLAHYHALGANAAAYAHGDSPAPIFVTGDGEALGARFHARVALIYAIETAMTYDEAVPEEIALHFKEPAHD